MDLLFILAKERMNQRHPKSRRTPHGGSEKSTQRKVPACKGLGWAWLASGSQSVRLIMCAARTVTVTPGWAFSSWSVERLFRASRHVRRRAPLARRALCFFWRKRFFLVLHMIGVMSFNRCYNGAPWKPSSLFPRESIRRFLNI